MNVPPPEITASLLDSTVPTAAQDTARIMRVLLFSSLYPNAARPQHAVFVENRLRHLAARNEVQARVVAPVPWFPRIGAALGRYGVFARVPGHESRFGIEIDHPRYPVIPKIGMGIAPAVMYAWCRAAIERLPGAGFDFDVIDAHYFYPDGVAAAMLGRRLGKPFVITARGSDINLIARHNLPRRMILWAAKKADALIAVSEALKTAMIDIGIPPDKIRVIRNGVDLDRFKPREREAARQGLGVRAPVIVSVGNLIPLKGHDLVIRALPRIPEAHLLIAGHGPQEPMLRRVATSIGVEERVTFLGTMPHAALADLYNAADVLVLASSREGLPNVVLEALACGTPVVATAAGGIPEVITDRAAGRLLLTRTSEEIARGVVDLLQAPPPRAATRACAERFTWEETSREQIDLFRGILGKTAENDI